MRSVYLVRAIPACDTTGKITGWVRVDIFADGTQATDGAILRDGSMCGQVEALARIAADPTLLYATEAEAICDGVARLRQAEREGELRPLIG